jgi:hypothetical protein
MRPFTAFILFSVCFTTTHAQQGLINQTDSLKKKHGSWVIYLDQSWKETKDSVNAPYYRFTHFEHGVDTQPTGKRKGYHLVNQATGHKQLLDGEYVWKDKNEVTRWVDVFRNGEPVSMTLFDKKGNKREYLDFQKQWRGVPNTYQIIIYRKNGKEEYYYMRPVNKHWAAYSGSKEGI